MRKSLIVIVFFFFSDVKAQSYVKVSYSNQNKNDTSIFIDSDLKLDFRDLNLNKNEILRLHLQLEENLSLTQQMNVLKKAIKTGASEIYMYTQLTKLCFPKNVRSQQLRILEIRGDNLGTLVIPNRTYRSLNELNLWSFDSDSINLSIPLNIQFLEVYGKAASYLCFQNPGSRKFDSISIISDKKTIKVNNLNTAKTKHLLSFSEGIIEVIFENSKLNGELTLLR